MNKLIYLTSIMLYLFWCGLANAQYLQDNEHLTKNIEEIKFIPPQEGEKPDTQGAGTRNPNDFRCSDNPDRTTIQQKIKAKAIVPDSNYGLTTQEYPEIFVDLANTSAKQVVLSVSDRNQEYERIVFFPVKPGSRIVNFSLPRDRPGLEEDTDYQWQIVFVCGDRLDVNDPILSGWIRRQSPHINSTELSELSAIEQADWYARYGYWYDFLSRVKLLEDSNLPKQKTADIWQDIVNKY